MRIFIIIGVTILVFISLLPVVADSIAIQYEGVETTSIENFTAANYSHQTETLVMDYIVYDIISLNVDSYDRIPVDNYIDSISGNEIVLKTSASDINDVIILEYTYLVDTPINIFSDNVQAVIDLIPLIILGGFISMIAIIMFKPRKV